MPDQNLIAKNLKLLKIDIRVHTTLLILSIIVFSLLIITNFDKSQPEHHKQYGCGLLCITEPKDLIVVAGFFTLSSVGILASLWQIISLILHKKWQLNWSKNTKFIRICLIVFYILLLLSLIPFLLGVFVFWSKDVIFFIAPFLFLFAISPIFWLVYYINLFGQRRFLKNYPLKKL